ncbi:MAG: hypothetical protein OXC26_05380 [Albidovulum sp.]|nr:hypothetical protein [Albidovulum sp.]
MRIARITGRVSSSFKSEGLAGKRMLTADVIDTSGKVLDRSIVVVDACDAGPGDLVLVATGSAARIPAAAAGIPTDASAVAFIDHLSVGSEDVDLKLLSKQ